MYIFTLNSMMRKTLLEILKPVDDRISTNAIKQLKSNSDVLKFSEADWEICYKVLEISFNSSAPNILEILKTSQIVADTDEPNEATDSAQSNSKEAASTQAPDATPSTKGISSTRYARLAVDSQPTHTFTSIEDKQYDN